MTYIHSFREYVEALRALDEIVSIHKEVDWDLEIGAIIRKSYDLKAPAPLFSHIKNSKKGMRVMGAPAALSSNEKQKYCRIALSIGLPADASLADILNHLSQVNEEVKIKPTIVMDGACKENILLGDQIDLLNMPVPLIHDGDGGRYINTWGTIVVQTPDKRWVNWSISRIMIYDKNTMVGLFAPQQHLAQVLEEWKAIDEPMPFALTLGTPPYVPYISGMSIQKGVNEVELLGGLIDEPIELIQCETVDLYVPSSTEIVIEGHVHSNMMLPEGPMGEYSGYMPNTNSRLSPTYKVKAVTYRNEAILPVVCAGQPVEEDHTCWALCCAAKIFHDLQHSDFPVTMCSSPPELALHLLAISVDKKKYNKDDLIERIADIVFSSKSGMMVPKVAIFDTDVDVTSTDEVMWAFFTRCHPHNGTHTFENLPVAPLAAFLHPHEKMDGHCTKVVYDCTWPATWEETSIPRKSSFDTLWPENIQNKVLKNWNNYGY